MKKKTLTRFLAGALAGVMALSMAAMLSGCGKDGGQASNDGTGTTTPPGSATTGPLFTTPPPT